MRKREKREKRKAVAEAIRKQAEHDFKLAQASKYLHHLGEYQKEHPDMRAILYSRVSVRMQRDKCNLDTYKKVLRREIERRGIPIISCYSETCSGRILNEKRQGLIKAVKEAKRYMRKGIQIAIVAPSSDRFLRNKYYTSDKPDLLPTEAEYEKLKELTCGVPLITLLHPDMPPREVRSYQSKWGQEAKGNKGGRPEKKVPGYKKRRKQKKLDKVIQLHKQGVPPNEVATLTNVPLSTINDWIAKYGR